jgi:hypothetical protein
MPESIIASDPPQIVAIDDDPGQDRLERPPGEAAMADLTPSGRAEPLDLADGERGEVVVEEERPLALALEVLDELRVVGSAERDRDEGLGLAPRKEGRAVGPRQHADLDRDRPDLVEGAAVEPLALLEDRLPRQRLDQTCRASPMSGDLDSLKTGGTDQEERPPRRSPRLIKLSEGAVFLSSPLRDQGF